MQEDTGAGKRLESNISVELTEVVAVDSKAITRKTDPALNPYNEDEHMREIVLNKSTYESVLSESEEVYPSNVVKTSRYTTLTFLPLNLWEQFHHLSNIYFLFVCVLQAIRPISTTNGVPTLALPLVFILSISAIRAALEDYARHVNDRVENNRSYKTWCFKTKTWKTITSGKTTVGQIIKVEENQQLPADCLMLKSSHTRGHGFVETASLDGESSLKLKNSVDALHEFLSKSEENIEKLSIKVLFEPPNVEFEQFKGKISLPDLEHEDIILEASHLLLRGTVLKNTSYVYCLVIYTGSDTKIRKNVQQGAFRKSSVKRSSIQKFMNVYLKYMFIFQILLCLLAGVAAGIFTDLDQKQPYLKLSTLSVYRESLYRFFTWFIILSQLVPISYQVSCEIVKAAQAYFIGQDITMYDVETDRPVSVQTNSLNEDLGQVQYIFSDKTGTLTQNRMQFRVAIINEKVYGSSETEISKRVHEKMILGANEPRAQVWKELVDEVEKGKTEEADIYVNFNARESLLSTAWKDCDKNASSELANPNPNDPCSWAQTYLLHMALSNTISPVTESAFSVDHNNFEQFVHNPDLMKVNFQASSPDEMAFCSFGKYMGFQLIKRNPTTVLINKFDHGKPELREFNLLGCLDFNSKRKRLTMIYQCKKTESVFVMCKGADSVMWNVIAKTSAAVEVQVNASLSELSNNGLRTLVLAHGNRDIDWWRKKWQSKYEMISTLPEKGDESKHSKGACSWNCRICLTMEEIEMDAGLVLLGVTAIEDRLQDLVPESIEDFLDAGIKFWMLTGDKRETAKNIALACNLIDPDMEQSESDNLLALYESNSSLAELRDSDLSYLQKNRLVQLIGYRCTLNESDEQVKNLFKQWDINSDGFISTDELQLMLKVLKLPIDISQVDDSMDETVFLKLIKESIPTFSEAVFMEIEEGIELINSIPCLEKSPVSLLIDGNALSAIYPSSFTNEEQRQRGSEMQDKFFMLASKCKSVVACRLTPHQKALIVYEVRKRKNAIALAVGDGANDEQMIKEANIGVGIAGLEGSAASRASDYAIGKFRFLHTLLFVHGLWSYSRMSVMTHYIFYKASLVCLSMFLFGFFSRFSGHQYYNDVSLQLYNIVFTSLPILIVAVFDRRLSRKIIEDNPPAYKSIRQGKLLNPRTMAVKLFTALVHAAIVIFMCNFALVETSSIFRNGSTHGIWFTSFTCFSVVVLNATFQLFFVMYSLTILHQAVIILNLVSYWFIMYALGSFQLLNPELYGVVQLAYRTPNFWLTLVLALTIPNLTTFMYRGWKTSFSPSKLTQLAEARILRKAENARKFAEKKDQQPRTLVRTSSTIQEFLKEGQQRHLQRIQLMSETRTSHSVEHRMSNYLQRLNKLKTIQEGDTRGQAIVRTRNFLHNPNSSLMEITPGVARSLFLDDMALDSRRIMRSQESLSELKIDDVKFSDSSAKTAPSRLSRSATMQF